MSDLPKPPQAYEDFIRQFPLLEEAWRKIHDAGKEGPLSVENARLVKLGIAVGAMREGAIRSSVRKAKAMGIDNATILQVVALSAGTLGLPSVVAVHSWLRELLGDG